jgi:hypothetical protein
MNDIRSSYVKVLPLIFLTGVLYAGLHLYHDFRFEYPPSYPWDTLEVLTDILKCSLLWTIIGKAFKKMKKAIIAFGTAIVLFILNYFLWKLMPQNALYNFLHVLLSNYTFIPALVFGWLCFKTRGLSYFLPVALLVYGPRILEYGSGHLTELPYNRWYAAARIDDYFTLHNDNGNFRQFNIPYYLLELAAVCLTFVLICECYNAAASQKKWKEFFQFDFSTRYTKRSGLVLFYSFRLAINMLMAGLFSYPLTNLVYNNLSPASSLLLNLVSALGLLVFVVLYYRKFLAEYFISIQKNINWLFWLVNIPVLGLLVFPFVVWFNRPTSTIGERTIFFNNKALNQKPYNVLVAILALSLLTLTFSPPFTGENALFWVLYGLELGLLALYVAEAWGFYVMLSINGVVYLYFLITTLVAVVQYNSRNLPFPTYLQQGTFTVIQYAILLPVFHLKRFGKAAEVITPHASAIPAAS